MSIPSVPLNAVINTGNGQIALTWQQVVGATSYNVQRSTTGIVGSFATVGTPSVNNFLDTTALQGIQYWYQVASVNSGTTGGFLFTVSSANASGSAQYTNNGQTFQVNATISTGTSLSTTSTGAPTASGTLTRISGSGDFTISFSAAVSTGGQSSFQTMGTNGQLLTAVPCLPGQINLGYLRYMVRVRTEKLLSQFVTDDQLNFYINQSAFRLYDMLVGKYGDDYFLSPGLVIPMTGLTSYPLPNGSNYLGSLNADGQFYVGQGSTPAPACYKLNGIDLNVGGTLVGPAAGWIPCARQNWSDRDKYTYVGQQATLYNVFQMSYREMGNQVYVFPVNSNTTMRWYYVPIMTQLLQDTDMMPFSISGWSELVIVDVCVKVLIQEESFDEASAFANERQALIDRINAIAPNRDVSSPNTVSNTRQTQGDPSFNGCGGSGSGSGFSGGWG